MKNIEEHADLLYSVYCEAVGGVAFNGDPLTAWEDFAADPKKQLQSDAWRSVAKQSLELEAALDTARELHQCEVKNIRNLMHYATGQPGHVPLSGHALEVRDAILKSQREAAESADEKPDGQAENVKEHAPPPAGAHSETGVEVQTTQDDSDKAAGGGCVARLVVPSSLVRTVFDDAGGRTSFVLNEDGSVTYWNEDEIPRTTR